MTPDRNTEHKVSYPTRDVHYAREHLIAASGLLHAIHSQYSLEGVLSVGAVLHVASVVDDVIARLKLADLAINQEELPF